MTAQTEAAQAPDLLYSEAEEDLRSAVRSLLADRADAPTVIAAVESDTPYDLRLWESLASGIGAAGLLVPEKLGGQGATHREAAVVLEELGRSVAPAPYLTSAVVATEIAARAGRGRWTGRRTPRASWRRAAGPPCSPCPSPRRPRTRPRRRPAPWSGP